MSSDFPADTSNSNSLPSGCPVDHRSSDNTISMTSGCPVDHTNTGNSNDYNPLINDFNYDKMSQFSSNNLSTKRSVSTIPREESASLPSHQPGNNNKHWVYPSEQQYYNAMKRKGYSPEEKDMPIVLLIHNLVNERGWSEIKEWESYRGNHNPKLVRFMGKPKEMSPKARFLSLIGYSEPFDRHDWIVTRNGKEIRYVIDFYRGKRNSHAPNAPALMYLDIRPALDSSTALIDRLTFGIRKYILPTTLPVTCLKTNPFFSSVYSYFHKPTKPAQEKDITTNK